MAFDCKFAPPDNAVTPTTQGPSIDIHNNAGCLMQSSAGNLARDVEKWAVLVAVTS